ncbi:MAG: recombinase family protein [Chloroflexota bacterium]|nr:recombinase family protein [Chloroflexota bacterium]
MKKYLPPAPITPKPLLFNQPVLVSDRDLAIYTRQSTKEQVIKNREAYDQQTIGLVKQGLELGWARDRIVVYIENKRKDGRWVNASGRLRIDQRPGLQALSERIEKDEVKTVLVWAVDRLFRDEDMIQPAVFAKLCKEHHCLIITTDDLFDFNNPRRDDRKRFLDAAQAAADYVTKHVKGRMLPARAQVSLRGLADGRRISMGYIVADRQRYLVDGSDNPNYKRLVAYEPHACVVRFLFRRYRELGGNLWALYREIDAWPCVFPFFEDAEHAKYVMLTKGAKGYQITRNGLATLLTNPIYIGWWYYKGQIVSKSNHDAIVPEDDFWYAFHRLSPVTMDGEINHRLTSQPARYTRDGTPPPKALLDGIITSEKRPVYVLRTEPPEYAIVDPGKMHGLRYKLSIAVPELDAIFVQRLLTVLEDTEHGATLQEHFKAVRRMRVEQLVSVDAQITEVKQQIAQWERSKRIAQEEEYEDGEREAVRNLKSKTAVLRELEVKQEQGAVEDADLLELVELLFGVSVGWDDLTFEKKRRFVRLSTKSITISEASTHFLKLAIEWTGLYGRSDVGYIWRRRGNGGLYREEENAILRELYPVADRAVLLDRLPHRSWSGILIQARRLGLCRHRSCGNSSSLHADLSRNDNEVRAFLGVEYKDTWPDKLTWWVSPSDSNSETPL